MEHVQVTDDGGQRGAHAQAGDDGQRALGHGLEHQADHGAGQPGRAQVHGGRHAVHGHATVTQHVHRVEKQHVKPGRMLTAEERERDERGLPHGGARVRSPTTVVVFDDGPDGGVGPTERGHGGRGAWRRRQGGQVVRTRQLEPEPPFGPAGFLIPATGSQPHRRGRHGERRRETDRARHAERGGHHAPVHQRTQGRGCHHAKAHVQREDQQVKRSTARRARFRYVYVYHSSGTCAQTNYRQITAVLTNLFERLLL